jgi:pSer/pThr/pTyr-binding forkhead associated (FHA) protein
LIRLTHLSGSLMGTASMSPKAVIRIGRGPDCDVRFDAQRDTRVSTHHAEIRFENGQYLVVDVGSTNGTFVNGVRLERPRKLSPGDLVRIGATDLRFEA